MNLTTPDGSTVAVELVERDGRTARFETDAATWARLHADGLLHTAGAPAGRPFLADRPVEIEATLDPTLDADDDAVTARTESWWALSATQAVDLPEELAGEGTLREGVSFRPPPWASGVEGAWRSISDEPLLDLVTGVFLDQGWDVERPKPDATIVQALPPDDLGDFQLWVRTAEPQQLVTVFATIPAEVPRNRIPEMLELAARLNGAVAVGSYEANADTGLLSFKTGIDVEGDRLSVALVRQLVGTAVVAAQRAQPLVTAVLAGEHTPRGAAATL
ncbi:MAG: hypothetical protein JWN29_2112 [Acidimicrobiales bacterium]|nr:hypothetical protein [Acidimicrobiales bacterium]